jgi:large subunit ribosomal protein L13
MRTTHITKPAEVERKWYVVDATGHTLGRLCTEVARILRGKHKAIYSPSVDTGDYVIVVNTDKVKITGKKYDQKIYLRRSGYIGRKKETTLRDMMAKDSAFVMEHAVKGMLPKNNLGRQMFTKFNAYAGPTHKHGAQQPEELTINTEID